MGNKTYNSPKIKVIDININPLMSGSNYIKTANRDYDGRAVLSRESKFTTWEESDE